MAAPTHTARSTPGGKMLKDGYSTKIAFAADPDVSLWEKTVQPPGLDGGDAIDITTMHNTTLRTFAPRSLQTMTEMQLTCAYDPRVMPQLLALINVETTVTVHYPNGDRLSFFGFLKNVDPSENTEGEQPEMTATIVPTNTDPSTGAEEDFAYDELHTGT